MTRLPIDPPVRTLADALALRPELLAGIRELAAALAAEPSLSPALLACCRARVETLVGATSSRPAPPPAPDAELACEFVEQFVLDPHGITDDLVARLAARHSSRAVVTLAQAAALWEGIARLARAFDVPADI